jgi:hypothetical protein
MVIQSSDVDLGGLVFYPDIQVGLCRADGLHGDINEAFLSETAEECVSSELAFWLDLIQYEIAHHIQLGLSLLATVRQRMVWLRKLR